MPAQEVRQFQVSTPPGTLASAPLITPLTLGVRDVTHVRVRVPPGPRGNLGWALAMAGTQVIPVNVGQWIIGDDETIEWDLAGYPNSGAWQLWTYNTGNWPHLVLLTFSLALVNPAGPPVLAPPLVVTSG